MRTCYLDTNVFVASYKTDDAYHGEASMIIKALQSGEIKGRTSVLTILETAAVASRMIQIRKGEDERDVRRTAVSKAILNLSRLGLGFVHAPGDSLAAVDGSMVEMPAVFHQALILAPTVALRSFDLVHLAAAKNARLMDSELGAFVTGDSAFLGRKNELSKIVDMPVLSPREYAEGLAIGR